MTQTEDLKWPVGSQNVRLVRFVNNYWMFLRLGVLPEVINTRIEGDQFWGTLGFQILKLSNNCQYSSKLDAYGSAIDATNLNS